METGCGIKEEILNYFLETLGSDEESGFNFLNFIAQKAFSIGWNMKGTNVIDSNTLVKILTDSCDKISANEVLSEVAVRAFELGKTAFLECK